MEDKTIQDPSEIPRQKHPTHKLRGASETYVYKMLAQRMAVPLIRQELKEKFGIEISERAIYQKREWEKGKAIIEKYRAEYQDDLAKLPASDKMHRLAVASRLIKMGLVGYKTTIGTLNGPVDIVKKDPYLAVKGVELAQKELGTDKDKSQNDALSKAGFTFNHIVQYIEDMPDEERDRLDFEWDALGIGGNRSNKGRPSRF